jgi:hypothetical protein
VLGSSWFRKTVLALAAIGIIVVSGFVFVIADPQAVAPYGCHTSWGRSFLPQAVCENFDNNVSKEDVKRICRALKTGSQCMAALNAEGRNPFAAFDLDWPALCTSEQIDKAVVDDTSFEATHPEGALATIDGKTCEMPDTNQPVCESGRTTPATGCRP